MASFPRALLLGMSCSWLAMAPAWAEPPTAQVELRNEQADQGLSLRLEQRQLQVPEADVKRERFEQRQLQQRQQSDSAVLRQQRPVEPTPRLELDAAARSQRRLHQQQDAAQRLQFRLKRRY
jgi:hypothetical protein